MTICCAIESGYLDGHCISKFYNFSQNAFIFWLFFLSNNNNSGALFSCKQIIIITSTLLKIFQALLPGPPWFCRVPFHVKRLRYEKWPTILQQTLQFLKKYLYIYIDSHFSKVCSWRFWMTLNQKYPNQFNDKRQPQLKPRPYYDDHFHRMPILTHFVIDRSMDN